MRMFFGYKIVLETVKCKCIDVRWQNAKIRDESVAFITLITSFIKYYEN